jgi:hypothetical protein
MQRAGKRRHVTERARYHKAGSRKLARPIDEEQIFFGPCE